MLKQDAVIEYINELHEKQVFDPIERADTNIAIIRKKSYVTVILKEFAVLTAGNETYDKKKNPQSTETSNRFLVHNSF